MIKETLKDVTFKYLFVHDFKWLDPTRSEQYQGHPLPGKIYRAVHNEKTGNYKVFIPPVNILMTDRLNLVETDDQECVSSIVEITKANIISLNLQDEELTKLTQWMDMDNKDIKDSLYKDEPMMQKGLESLQQAIDQQSREEAEAMFVAKEVLTPLLITNSLAFDLLLEIAYAVHQDDMENQNSNTLSLALGPDGKGANMSQVLMCVNEYLDKPKNGGDDRDSLIALILHAFTELQRRVIQDLDED